MPWAKQGVLMLNTILTLRAGEPLSHKGRGWETFTDEIIRKVSDKTDPVVFVLWGKQAQGKIKFIDETRHRRSKCSSFTAVRERFLGTKPFSQVNAALRTAGKPEIDWRIPSL